ncbi:hypothetical protein [Algihabitans albus]|uniref:hypothetical protein n=1 Tax=Algihabitans albus TaxID=2164067 RepID=UPI001ABCC7EC|nr:hypothetical protein [Algihabitans albus]
MTFILALACWLPGMTAWRLRQRLAFTLVGLAGLGLVVSAIGMGFFGFRIAGYL